jgi:hypothetical protein
MITQALLESLLPLAVEWVAMQERFVLKNGRPLSEDQQIDAHLAGVQQIKKVRLWESNYLPVLPTDKLRKVAEWAGLFTANTIGITFRYGIYLHADHAHRRSLVVHELAHTMQYERAGGIRHFLRQYLDECLRKGYPHGELEREAREIEQRICRGG